MTEPDPLQQIDRTFVRVRGKKFSYFSGCDYFRMASHPRVLRAAKNAISEAGLNVAASRMTTGNHELYEKLESRVAKLFDSPAALLVSNGYATNLIVAQALEGQFSHVLIDEGAHPSLQDASSFQGCPVLTFKHQNPEHVAQITKRVGPQARWLLMTDGHFSRNGSVAPIDQYLKILPGDAMMIVDDAHGAGVVGETGKGTHEHFATGRKQVIQTLTLSKAFGTYGGVILCSAPLRKQCIGRSRMFVGSTPLPLPLASAALAALEIFQSDSKLLPRLRANTTRVKTSLQQIPSMQRVEFANSFHTPGPIVSLLPRSAKESQKWHKGLSKAGIFPPLLIYPGGPPGGYFRFVISSEHGNEQLENLIATLRKLVTD